jgi:photosystem II stability/assembly factor-like uncharacterized protein
MKSLAYLVLIVFIFGSCKKNSNTELKNTSALCLEPTFLVSTIAEPFQGVFFINGKDGFLSGYNGGIYKTTDSAKTWTHLNSTVNLPIRSLFFVDAQKGFAVGGQNSCDITGCTPAGGFILRTTNGGDTWEKVYTPTDKIEISSVFFVSPTTGFCAGDNVIMKTSDGGQNWTEHKITNLGGKIMQVRFATPLKGYVVCLFDKLVVTMDGGNTWQVTSPQRSTGYYDISEAGGDTYLAGQGKVIKSTNGGISWIDLPNAPSDIFAIHFITNEKGFAFGRGTYSGGDFGYSYGSIFCTDNGGDTWNGRNDIKEIGSIESVSFPSNDLGYAISGNKLVRLTLK